MNRSVEIANEFLRKAGKAGLTQMQLQKLVFIAHGWNLALSSEGLTSDTPEAWTYGPVYPDLYNHTKFFGNSKIDRLITADDDEAIRFFMATSSGAKPYRAVLDDRERQIIDRVWARYGTQSGAKLSALTHQTGTPWALSYKEGGAKNAPIPDARIKQHYDKLAAASAAAN